MNYENLVLEGGGIKGLSYIGAFKALNDLNKMKDIKRVIGTSVGSIFAIFIACKFDNNEICKMTSSFFSEITQLDNNLFTEGINLVKKMGIHDNTNIYNAINEMLFDKFGIKNMTMKQLFEKTEIELTTVGTCLSTRKCEYFNHNTYPDIEVAKAIQISTSIPIFFTKVEWDGKMWADGGIVENFAINFYDSEGKINDKTLGLYLQNSEDKKPVYDVDSILELLEGIEEIEIQRNIDQSIKNYEKRHLIKIDTGNISPINFNINNNDKNFLIKSGYDSTINFFEEKVKKLKEYEEYQKSWTGWFWSWLGY